MGINSWIFLYNVFIYYSLFWSSVSLKWIPVLLSIISDCILSASIRRLDGNLINDIVVASRQYDIFFCSETLVFGMRLCSKFPGFEKPIFPRRNGIPRAQGMIASIRNDFSASYTQLLSLLRLSQPWCGWWHSWLVWRSHRKVVERPHSYFLVTFMFITASDWTLVSACESHWLRILGFIQLLGEAKSFIGLLIGLAILHI